VKWTDEGWLTVATACTDCEHPADAPDGLCAPCRAERACRALVNRVWDALEAFFDGRYQPHDGTGQYYFLEPAPEFNRDYHEIRAAIDQTCGGIKKLVELALGRQVEMIPCLDPRGDEGIAFRIDYDAKSLLDAAMLELSNELANEKSQED
jgi:hypothetical protein